MTIVSCSTLTTGPYLFYLEKFITQFKTTENNIGHRTRFRENGDFLHGEVQPQRKSRDFLMRALMTREIMRSRDEQCNTGELP